MDRIHASFYPVALEMAKKFVDGKDSVRPVLETVHHRADGSMIATDSRKLLLVKNAHGFKEDFLVNPRTFEFFSGTYPTTEKIIPEDKPAVIVLDKEKIGVWLQAHKSMKIMLKNSEDSHNRVALYFQENQLLFKIAGGIEMRLPFTEYAREHAQIEVIYYNADYMVSGLETLLKLKVDPVYIKIYGQMDPFILDSNGNSMVLILPIRVY